MSTKAKKSTITQNSTDVIDLDLSVIRKKRFRIDGDDNKILEINTSDLGVGKRLSESYPKLENLATRVQDLVSTASDEDSDFKETQELLDEVDKEMRTIIDYIFNANVSEICASDGTMYDPINGSFRYEHIINLLGNLYEDNMDSEIKKIQKKMKEHTDKYIK